MKLILKDASFGEEKLYLTRCVFFLFKGLPEYNRITWVLPPDWRAASDKNGRTYYINDKTKETSWAEPQVCCFFQVPQIFLKVMGFSTDFCGVF